MLLHFLFSCLLAFALVDEVEKEEEEEEEVEGRLDGGSLCNLTRVGRRPEWREASIRDGRWVLPFLVHPGGVPPLVVVLRGDLEARLEIGRRRARMQVGELDVADSGLMPGLFSVEEERGFWMRVRNTNSKTVVSIHPAGSLDWKDSIVEVEIRDEEEIPESWEFAFLTTSTPITVATDCRLPLGSSCSHSLDCEARGSGCQGNGGPGVGRCICDSAHTLQGEECVGWRRAVGEECTSSRQCWGVGGRCRKGRCVCPVTMHTNSQGQCVLQPHPSPWNQHTKTLARPFAKQHKSLQYFNRPAASAGKFFSHCSFASSGQASPYWPVIWQRTGFLVSGFYLPERASDSSSFTISFFLPNNNRDADSAKPVFSIEFGPGWIQLDEGLEDSRGERRVAAEAKGMQWWSVHYKCNGEKCRLEVGLGGGGVPTQPFLFNQPRYQVISGSPPSPAVVSFRVVTRGGRVVSGCKGRSGQVCAPPGGCSPGFFCQVRSGQDSGGLCEPNAK